MQILQQFFKAIGDILMMNPAVSAAILLVLNLASFIAFGVDKSKAKKHLWRIPEATLLIFCAIFGAAGGFIGMHIFHHKTKKPKFFITVPALLVLQLIFIGAALFFTLK